MNDGRGFKKKTINLTIKNKMAAWLRTIEDEKLRDDAYDHLIVTGGAIASMLQGELPNDYDVYFDDVEIAARLAKYYIRNLVETSLVSKIEVKSLANRVAIHIKSAGVASEDDDMSDYQYFEGGTAKDLFKFFDKRENLQKSTGKYRAVNITSNAITLTEDVQLIVRFTGNPAEIHENYDYVHATNYWTAKDGVVLNQSALESTLSKELKYVGSVYPICSMFRLKKFINRGWTITAGEMLKIAWDINKLDLNDIHVLEDQLVGVDAAYFHELLSVLSGSSDKELDRTYLFEMINRVFDDQDLQKIDFSLDATVQVNETLNDDEDHSGVH